MSFAKIKEVQETPYLIEVQKKSYDLFINEGLHEVLRDASGCDRSHRQLNSGLREFFDRRYAEVYRRGVQGARRDLFRAMRVKIRLTTSPRRDPGAGDFVGESADDRTPHVCQ